MKWPWRILHGLAVVAVGLGALVVIGVIGFSIVVTTIQNSDTAGFDDIPILNAPLVAACIVFLLGIAAIIWKLHWRWLSMAAAVVAGMLVWLAWDEPAVPPPKMGKRIGDQDLSYRVFMWLSATSPHSRLKEPGVLDWNDRNLYLPSDKQKYPFHAVEKRVLIEQAWDNGKRPAEDLLP